MKAAKASSQLGALEKIGSGVYLPSNALAGAMRVVICATSYGDGELPELADKCAQMQLHFPFVKPYLLISALDPSPLSRAGFVFETALSERAWEELEMELPYSEYLERRVGEMIQVYRGERFATVEPGARLPRWLYER